MGYGVRESSWKENGAWRCLGGHMELDFAFIHSKTMNISPFSTPDHL